MRFWDMVRMSAENLWKRKVRTALTILGVVIGTAAIVVMVSIGLGLNKAVMEQMQNFGSMTTITVNPTYARDNKDDPTANYLSEDSLAKIRGIEHVDIASPVLSLEVLIFTGKYMTNTSLRGMSLEGLQNLGMKFGEGGIPEEGDDMKIIYGNMLLSWFSNAKTGESPYWSTGELPKIDFMNDTVKVIFDSNAYYTYQGDTTGQAVKPKRYTIETAGVIAGGVDEYSQFSYSTYCDIDALKAMMKKVFRGKVIPGQPTTKSGKAYKEFYYNEIYVNVDDMNNVVDVQKKITDLGYQANSNMEMVEYAQQQFGFIEAVLGGIGAVAMLIAAISIANTMTMSVFERTKEIGIMKVLGCNMHNIQAMFLFEAAFIGIIGGILGAGFSYLASYVVNLFASQGSFMGVSTGMSYIPMWLSLLGVAFATGISTLAGFFPSLRAMKLSPLAAIRNE